MTTTKQRALAALADAKWRPFLANAPLMAIVEAVAVLDEAGLLIDSDKTVHAHNLSNAVRERLADARATASLLGSEGFTGIRLETQVRSLIEAWSDERDEVRRQRSARAVALQALIQLHDLAEFFDDEALGQSSTRLRYQFQAHEGFETLGLDGIDAARAELRAAAEPADPDAPIPYTLSVPPPGAAPEVTEGAPCPKCGERLNGGRTCLNFPACPDAIMPF